MKLHDKTPDTFVYFISGSLPAAALVHMRQLGLFNMICHLPNNIMNRIAKHALMTEPDTSRSWFIQIRRLCDMYDLPSPLVLLTDPISKDKLKNLVKSKVMDYWEKILRHEASQKPSLLYFKPQFYSLRKPHNIITSTGSNSFELNKSICQIRMLSGRYRDDWLCRHWSPHNKSGECTLCHHPRGDLRHLLVLCQALEDKRKTLFYYWDQESSQNPYLRYIISEKRNDPNIDNLVGFILDPSADPAVIDGCQNQKLDIKHLFKITRTFCYGIHRRRLQLTGRFNCI